MARGIVGILTAPDGQVIVTTTDFEMSGPGGFTRDEAQRSRARYALARELVRKYTYGDIGAVIENYTTTDILDKLCRQKGYRATYLDVDTDAPNG